MEKLFGLLFLSIGLWVIISEIKKMKTCTSITEGKVIDIAREEINSSNYKDDKIHLYPIFEYTVDCNVYIKQSNTSSSNYFMGQTVKIHYDPFDPNKFYVNSSSVSVILIGIMFTIGGILAIILA